MFFRKITTQSNGKTYTYVKLIENYRKGNKVKQRVIANLGNIEDLSPSRVKNLITSLSKVCGVESSTLVKPRAKRVLRFGDVMLIHKTWEKLGLHQIISDCQDAAPDTAPALELLVIEKLLGLPPGAIEEWRRHLYLPAFEHVHQLDLAEALRRLAKIKDQLESCLFQRLQERLQTGGRAPASPVYCYVLKGCLEKDTAHPPHLLSRPPERVSFSLNVFTTREGIPCGQKIYLHGGSSRPDLENLKNMSKTARAAIRERNCNLVLVGNFSALPEETLRALHASGIAYITGLSMSSPKEQALLAHGLPDDFPDAYSRLYEDLWYKEIKKGDGTRYLLCLNPLLAADSRGEPENRSFVLQTAQEGSKQVSEKQTACRGKLILKTNAQNLPPEEVITAYSSLAALQKRYRRIKCPAWTPAEAPEGQIFITGLAHLTEKFLDYILQEQGMNINGATALQIMEPVKIIIGEMGGETITSTVTMNKTQRKILSCADAGTAHLDGLDFPCSPPVLPGLPEKK